MANADNDQPTELKRLVTLWLQIALRGVIGFVLVAILYGVNLYTSTPEVVRHPHLQHYHFRMQILVNGNAENFGDAKYQQGSSQDQCNVRLTKQPIHFHDNRDQLVHIHWDGMTGGIVMKYLGWNYIGGPDNSLGYRLDSGLMHPLNVPIKGKLLPAVTRDLHFYIFSGDEHGYREQAFNNWVDQDLETFFGKQSNLPGDQPSTSLLDKLFPKVYAHGIDDQTGPSNESTEQRLTRINNLIGNVVIFVQKDRPTDQQIKDRFNQLLPLSDSTCGD